MPRTILQHYSKRISQINASHSLIPDNSQNLKPLFLPQQVFTFLVVLVSIFVRNIEKCINNTSGRNLHNSAKQTTTMLSDLSAKHANLSRNTRTYDV